MMNLVLHGVGAAQHRPRQRARPPITQIGKRERVDVILTNPPFGGEEEKTIQSNFPADKQTAETAWLFLQLVMRQLKDGGRCGIVVPERRAVWRRRRRADQASSCSPSATCTPSCGFLTACSSPTPRSRRTCSSSRRPGGRRRSGSTRSRRPTGRKKYSKTKPMRFEEFADCQAWWTSADRRTSGRGACLAGDVVASGYNLDRRNPKRPDDLSHRPPKELLADLVDTEREILALPREARRRDRVTVPQLRVGDLLRLERRPVTPDPLQEYISIGIRSFGHGIFHYEPTRGDQLGKLRFFEVVPDRLVVSNIKAWEGAVAISGARDAGCLASNRFLAYEPCDDRIDVRWARWFFLSERGNELLQRASPGRRTATARSPSTASRPWRSRCRRSRNNGESPPVSIVLKPDLMSFVPGSIMRTPLRMPSRPPPFCDWTCAPPRSR